MTLKSKEGTQVSEVVKEAADMFMLHEDALEAVRQWRREKALDRLVADAQKDGFYDDLEKLTKAEREELWYLRWFFKEVINTAIKAGVLDDNGGIKS